MAKIGHGMAGRGHARRSTEIACGSKEFDPPFPFPPGESRGGDGSPHAAHAARQPNPLARIDAAAPPARGVSKRSAETPLARSPRLAPPVYRRPRSTSILGDRSGGKELRMAATSALTFTTFS